MRRNATIARSCKFNFHLEIGIKIKNGKLDIGTSLNDYVRRLASLSCIEIRAVVTEIWVDNIGMLWDHRDQADWTLVSTARLLGLPLVTKDKVISDFLPGYDRVDCVITVNLKTDGLPSLNDHGI